MPGLLRVVFMTCNASANLIWSFEIFL